MGFSDKLKDLTKKAQEAAAEHQEQLHQAVEKAETTANRRTGGRYRDQISRAGEKANALVDSVASKPAAAEDGEEGTKAPR